MNEDVNLSNEAYEDIRLRLSILLSSQTFVPEVYKVYENVAPQIYQIILAPMRYKPLNTVKDEIRLFRVLHTKSNLLHLTLENFPFDTAPPFWAFSYIWGDPTRTRRIVVNGHNFDATEKLVFAIRNHVEFLTIRSDLDHPHFFADYIWADAICINQNDIEERSQQVLRMRRIYQKGIVCIYLNSEDRDAYKPEYTAITNLYDQLNQGSPVEIPEADWPYLVQFFSKTWFHRMWVIQEFIMARSQPLFLLLGGYKGINVTDLRDVAWEIFGRDLIPITIPERTALFSGIKQYLSMAEVKDRMVGNFGLTPCSFITLLWTFRDRLASDPKDKIYSLLGLVETTNTKGDVDKEARVEATGGLDIRDLIINYEPPLEDIYTSLVKSMVNEMQSLNVICACQAPGAFTRSWVPDWSEPWSRVSLLAKNISMVPEKDEKDRFNASGTQKPVVEFWQDNSILNATGICWCTVAVLGTQKQPQDNGHWVNEWFQSLDSTTRQLLDKVYGEEEDGTYVSFIFSICAGRFTGAEAQARDYYQFYPGASEEWHEKLRHFKIGELDEEGNDFGTIDIRIAQMGGGRQIFIGDNGYCGLVPDHTEFGDLLCVLFGCDVPVVLRKVGDHYIFIGECYIEGLMQGQAIEALNRGEILSQQFAIH